MPTPTTRLHNRPSINYGSKRTLLERYRGNKIRKIFESFFDSRLFYVITLLLTFVAFGISLATRNFYFRGAALSQCYNTSQITPNCFDKPECYNQTILTSCYVNHYYRPEDAKNLMHKMETQTHLSKVYTGFLVYFVIETIVRFVMSPSNEFDAIYDMFIIVCDCVVSFRAMTGSDSFIYFGIALPIRIGLFIADVEVLRPTFYKLSLSFPKLIYFGLLFFSLMYFFCIPTFLLFSSENNPDCIACIKYFPDLQKTFTTMLQVAMWANWGEVVDALLAENSFPDILIICYFVAFASSTTFVLFNVFYAVICEIILDYSNPNFNKVPKNASNSFWNRVVLEILFQFFEIMLSNEDQKKIENEELSTSEKLRLISSAIKRYFRNFTTNIKKMWEQQEMSDEDDEIDTVNNNINLYGTAQDDHQVQDQDVKAIASQMSEVINLLKSMEKRIDAIEKKMM
ncbi:hypothetical protein AKO1_009093 [Acrasis kona]|uniref:Ion transport domain-containing protein n=1 Tax=Acrasis kona TaxID=1008807 RepID=A0AAW2ZJP2_9EUKA